MKSSTGPKASILDSGRSHHLIVLILALSEVWAGSNQTILHAQISKTGQPSISGTDPGQQSETDWVDNRWSRSEVGPFLASSLRVPGGQVLKGLSIKVGADDEAAICFDTSGCTFPAAWIGGFLDFAPARFGLIRPPDVAGEIALAAPFELEWGSDQRHYRGLHLNGRRIVLEYNVGDMRVFDSPWFEKVGELAVFSRTLELGARSDESLLIIRAEGRNAAVSTGPQGARVFFTQADKALAVAMIGSSIQASKANGKVLIRFPPADSRRRFRLLLWSGNKSLIPEFNQFADAADEIENLTPLLKPGPARWSPKITTTGKRGFDTGNFAVDTLTLPYDNPWNALMFLSGVGFRSDGVAYVSTIHGDVWQISGIDETLENLHWKRFATGLYQPLGLQVREDEIFVLGRDQITRLHDLNDDGEADFYENFHSLIDAKPGHNYVAALERDSTGNFYYVDPIGVHRVSPDGLQKETLATGFRNPNGLGVSPDGEIITVAPQQGEWTPSSEICEITLGGYYGYGGPKIAESRPLGYDSPLCWIPHRTDNSSGSQVWIPRNHWGPLEGRMLHLLWGRCGIMLVLRDVVGGVAQGAVVPLPVRFLSGPQRAVFHRGDGHLYVAGSTGWQTSAIKDGALQRVRFTGEPVYLPVNWRAHENGLTMRFPHALDRETAEDPESYAIYRWNYRYARQYGSKDWSLSDPNREGRDEVSIKSSRLLSDRMTVFLEIPNLSPVMQMEVKYNIDSADGKVLQNQIWLTLNKLDPNRNQP